MANYKTLDVWKFSMELVKEVYMLTKKYPKDEMFGLTSQTKRAAVSVPANIAEGLGRQYRKDTLQFLFIARGSLYELETELLVAVMTEIIQQSDFDHIQPSIENSLKTLNGLIRSIEQRPELK